MTANSKDPAKDQARRPVDKKPRVVDTVASALPPRVWVDEGWGYQVEQSEQSRSASHDFEPIEYESTAVVSPQAAAAGGAPAPAAPDAGEQVADSDDAPVPPAQWTLVGPD